MSPTPPPDEDRTVMPTRTATGVAVSAAAAATGGGNTLPIGTHLGEFEITGLVGEGGFGIVYLAYDHSLQRRIAIKEYMPSALAARTGVATVAVKSARHAETFQAGLKSFINEARLLAQFDHPSLVKVYRFWEANGTAYMVMPFYEGITLKEALKKLGGPPDEGWLKDFLRPLTDALAQIHREQCFHRDIAPDNIIILKEGRPLLLDFGAARRVIGDMTHALTVILKPGYAPVEQYAEVPSMKQGAWTDIYALASVVYFAITGRAPVPSVARLMSDPLVPLAKVAAGRYSEQFLQGIDKALSVKPEDRPQDIAELRALIGLGDRRQQMRAALPSIAPEAEPAVEAEQEPAPRREVPKPPAAESRPAVQPAVRGTGKKSQVALYAIGAVILVALIGGGVFFILSEQKPEPSVTAEIVPKPTAPTTAPQPEVKPPLPETTKEVLPPPSPPPQPEKPPFSPGQMLDDIFDGRNRQHAVTASVEKAQVRIGRDHLRFNISSSKPGYLYVLVVGTNRSDFDLLFPNAVDKNNRVAPGKTMRLPGNQWPMTAQGPAGTDQFIAIVSDQPRDFTDLGVKPDDVYKKFPLDIGAQIYRDYSGSTPLYAGKVVCQAGTACSQSYGAAVFSIEEVAGSEVRGEARAPAIAEAPPPKAAPVAVAPKMETVPAAVHSSPKMEARSERCSDILQRASLGETLTREEQTLMTRDCR